MNNNIDDCGCLECVPDSNAVNTLTPELVKAFYEANINTEVFTSLDKVKLNTLHNASNTPTGVVKLSAGTNISIDNTDPLNPIISSSGGAGSTGPKGDKGDKGDKGGKGDIGLTGPSLPGTTGQRGSKLFTGNGVPTAMSTPGALPGDVYLDNITDDYYQLA